jgi:hypothetical protein
MVQIPQLWIRMKLMHWIDLQIQSTPIVLCSVISKIINQKSKNHDTLVWSLYVKSEGNVLTNFGCRFFQLCGCTSEWWCYCGWRELHREIPTGERAVAMHAGPISKWLSTRRNWNRLTTPGEPDEVIIFRVDLEGDGGSEL